MKRLAGFGFILMVLAAVAPARADRATAGNRADLRELRRDADLLDDSLSQVDADHPRAREFRRREGELHDRLMSVRNAIDDGRDVSQAEVEALRRDISDLRRDVDATLDSSRRSSGDVSVPDGTEIRVRLEDSVSSQSSRPEDRVAATVSEPVRINGRLAIPAGTELAGTIRSVEPARRPAHGGRVELSFESMVVNGQRLGIRARLVSIEQGGLDKRKAGLGALLGGVVGAVIDGKKGALIGAVLGGGSAVVATKGDDVELPAGTLVTLRLDRPVSVVR
jgi:hypothetical protein